MLNAKLNAHRGFTPATLAPQKAIPPEQVYYVIIAIRFGVARGTGTVPSIIYL